MSKLTDEEKQNLSLELSNVIMREMKKWVEKKDSENKYELAELVSASFTGLMMSFHSLSENMGISEQSYGYLNEFAFKMRNGSKK